MIENTANRYLNRESNDPGDERYVIGNAGGGYSGEYGIDRYSGKKMYLTSTMDRRLRMIRDEIAAERKQRNNTSTASKGNSNT